MTEQARQSGARILVIVPAFNEADSIGSALAALAAHVPSADVVVVDDGSADKTVAVARSRGVPVLSLPCNLGVGGAMQTGYLYAWRNGYDVAVQVDADGQHPADRIPDLCREVLAGQADLVIGSRRLADVPFRFGLARFIGSRILAALVRVVGRQRITDPTSGFRAFSRRAIRFFANYYPQTYLGDTVEALVWAARQRMSIKEVPAAMRQRANGASTAGNIIGFLHTLRIILAILVDCLEPPIDEEELE